MLLASETEVLSRSYIYEVIQKNAHIISVSHLSGFPERRKWFKILSTDAEKKKEYYFTAFKFQDWKLDKEFSLKS